MDCKTETLDEVLRQGFLPIFVRDELDPRMLVDAAAAAGCRVLEYTCRRPDAREVIPWIKKTHPDIKVLGASLIDGPRSARSLTRVAPQFIGLEEMSDLGVDGFISMLRFRDQTYADYGQRMAMVPGVSTPNEAIDQLEVGADLVKAVVSTSAGMDLVCKSRAATHGLFPFLVTGGVTGDRLETCIEAGVLVGSAGFDLILGADIAAGRAVTSELVEERIEAMLVALKHARQRHQPMLYEAIEAGRSSLIDVRYSIR